MTSPPRTLSPFHGARSDPPRRGLLVNDVHSRLNSTMVRRIVRPICVEEVQRAVRAAARAGEAICVGGGWHSMGAQQFAHDAVLLDMRGLDQLVSLDGEHGIADVEAGVQWPALISELASTQRGLPSTWGIRQKQTGADRLTLGGAVASNIHGRGLAMSPFIGDVDEVTLVDPDGDLVRASRTENAELFSLVFGGYGLFGPIVSMRLRLARRHKVERVVEIRCADDLVAAFEQRIADGFEFGDFQFAIDPCSPDFLHRGVFSCYRPVADDTPIPLGQRMLSDDAWRTLLHAAHVDKSRAFEHYCAHYRVTNGQIYWSDTHQLAAYIDHYHEAIDAKCGAAVPGSEMITEVYVPRRELAGFLRETADDFRANDVNCIYGTVRLIERDDESFLAWAREPYACVIFNLHVDHSPSGLERAETAFRRLIDGAAQRGGSYYLTYHRYATAEQVLACHPRMPDFLRRKRAWDPDGRFQSEWYRHYDRMFGDAR